MTRERPAMVVERLTHSYGGDEVLREVSLSVDPGELVCLLGPSGCGKTTLLRLVAGLEPVQRGRVVIAGEPVGAPGVHVPPERRGVGLVFQDLALLPHLSVLENVAFGVRAPAAERRRRALEQLERTGMAGFAQAYPHTLSGGQQQRVAVARALAPEPRLVLLDEPFSGLDAGMRGRVRDDTLDVLQATGVATVMVTHDPEEAMFMGSRIALMDEGRIVQLGPPKELYSAPTSAFAASFLAEVNRIDAVVDGGLARTPVGDFPAGDFRDGARVQVLIRPEALLLELPGPGPGVEAHVTAAHMLGRSSLVYLRVPTTEGSVELQSRAAGDFFAHKGEVLRVLVDHRRTFLFPAG
jgi:iron(III) transport system ATP-binding protein